jgi:hypothetical protein
MVRRFMVKAFAAAAMVAMSSTAFAATIIDFRNGGASAGGTITYDGTNVFGSNIPIGLAETFNAPNGVNNVFDVDGAITQAPNFSSDGDLGSLDFNTATGVVTLMGCIPGLNVGLTAGGACIDNTVLLSGTISGFSVSSSGGGSRIDFTGFDTKHPALVAALGLAPNTPFIIDSFALLTGTLSANGGAVNSISTDVRNTAVPEPATMMLLGTGLLAAFRARRRQAA